ncbi:AMP-binding protein [Halomarina salina]|uniref:AMP-binding protein n=1 Tax=Halomarina salina TaxID=1872699 RepID=A0ABD5RLX8_9EURY|nr:class I adenylate-forming enzyme family protein [Halomarina salina]
MSDAKSPDTRDAERPWLAEYERYGVPESLEPYPDQPAHQFLYDAAEKYPEQGIAQSGTKLTYPELVTQVEKLATALHAMGVEQGDRVATVLPTSIQFVVATNAISRLGATHIPNDFLDATDDLVYRLEQGDPDVLIGHDEHRDLLETLREELDLDSLVLTSLDDYSASIPDHDGDREPDVEWLPDLIASHDADPPDVSFDPAEDVHTLLFTGGTTGLPKGCLLTHRNLVANALQATAAQSRLTDLMRGEAAGVMALPMYHAYGYSVTHSLVELGLDLVLVPDARDTDLLTRQIGEYEPMVVLGVPTQFMDIVDEELDHSVIGISGSAPLASETQDRFGERSGGGGLSQGYGLSEMSPITHFNVAGISKALSGRDPDDEGFDQPTIGVPVPDTEVKLVDVDTGDPIPIGEAVAEEREGELWLNGPQRMAGYLDADDPFDEDGFVATGDVAKVDPRGRFYIVDRVKNMVNVSGLKVYTEEVDDVLHDMPEIRRAATIGVPDPDRPGSEQVVIYVQPERGTDIDGEDVREHLDDEVPRHAMPEAVALVEEIPLTDIGKVDKKELREGWDEEE